MAADRKEWQNPDEILDQLKIKEGWSVVDLGCGPGFFTVPLSKRVGKNGKVFAVDSDSVMLHHLESNLQNTAFAKSIVEMIQADVCASGIPSGCADMVLFANLLHDLDNQKIFFDEVTRMLSEDGRIVDIDWQRMNTNALGPPLDRRLSENQSRIIIRENGYRIINALNAGPYHYGFICERDRSKPK